MNTHGIEIGTRWTNGQGSDYVVKGFASEALAREAYRATMPPQKRGGYVSLVELDTSGAPCETIETREYSADLDGWVERNGYDVCYETGAPVRVSFKDYGDDRATDLANRIEAELGCRLTNAQPGEADYECVMSVKF